MGGCFSLFIDAENSSKLRVLNEVGKKFKLLAKYESQAARIEPTTPDRDHRLTLFLSVKHTDIYHAVKSCVFFFKA